MIEIPEEIKREAFRFLILPKGQKFPPETNWTKDEKKQYRYDDPKLIAHLKENGNYGVVCGKGLLTVIDADSEELKKAIEENMPATFCVLTPHRKGKHFYYFCNLDKPIIFDRDKKHYGESRWFGQYAVSPGSVIEDGRYEVVLNVPIATITQESLLSATKGLLPKNFELREVQAKLPDKAPGIVTNATESLLAEGVSEGQRNKTRFQLVKDLWNNSVASEKIKEIILSFNSKCSPPEAENVVTAHVEYLLKNAERYLTRDVGDPFLLERKYGTNGDEKKGDKGIEERNKKQGIGVFNAAKFMKLNIPRPEFLVDGMIIDKSLTILGGFQSSFKTHFATLLALSLANGKALFGKFETKKSNVLYVNEELHTGDFQKLILKLGKGNNLEVPSTLFLMNFANWKIDSIGDNKKFEGFIKKNEVKLVIFDTFRECFSAIENSADEIIKVLHEYLRPLIKETNCSFLIIMHKGKAGVGTENRQAVDLIRGSSVFRNYADSILLLERPRKQDRVVLTHEKIRGSKEISEQNINWHFEDDRITATVLSEEELEKLLIDSCQQEILVFLKTGSVGEFETGEDSKIFKTFVKTGKFSNGTFHAALKELCQQGKVLKVKRGLYRMKERGLDDF